MKATIQAELLAMGEIDATQDHEDPTTIGPVKRGILLACMTDDDVRAFAPLMCQGVVTLEIQRVEHVPPEDTPERRAEMARLKSALEPRDGDPFDVSTTSATLNREIAAKSAIDREIRALLEHGGRMSPLDRAKSLAEYRPRLRQMMNITNAPYPAAELAGVMFDLVDSMIALIADGVA